MMNRVIALVTACVVLTVSGAAQAPRLQMQTSHTATIRMIDIDGSSSLCVTASNDYSVRVWSASLQDRGSLLRVLAGHQAGVSGAILNPNNSDNVISWSSDHTVRIWSVAAGTHTVIRLDEQPTSVDVRSGSNLLAVATASQEVAFFDVARATTADRTIEVGYQVRSLRFSPSGQHLLVAGTKGELLLIHTRTREMTRVTLDTKRPIVGAYWTSDETWIAISDEGDIYSGRAERLERTVRLQTRLRAVSRQLREYSVAMLTEGGEIVAYNIENGDRLVLRQDDDVVSLDAVALFSDGLVLIGAEYAGGQHPMSLRSTDGRSPRWRPSSKASIITAVQFLAGTKDLLVGDNGGACWYWSTHRGARPSLITSGEFDKVQVLRESPDRQHLVMGGFGRQVCGIVNVGNWDIRWLMLPEVRGVRSADYMSSTSLLIVDEGTGDVINVDTSGRVLQRWPARAQEVYAVDTASFVVITNNEVQLYRRGGEDIGLSLTVSATGSIRSSEFNKKRRIITLYHSSGGVYSCDIKLRSRQPFALMKVIAPGLVPEPAAITGYSSRILLSGVDGTLRMHENSPSAATRVVEVCRLFGRPTTSAITSDGDYAAIGMQDGSVHTVALATGGIAATIHATTDGWTVATPHGLYDGDNAAQSSLLVIVGSEVRTLSEMPAMYQSPNLLRRVYGIDDQTVLSERRQIDDILFERPARVEFVARSSNMSVSDECSLTYRLESHGAAVRSVIVTEGSRVVYQRRSTTESGIRSHIGSFRTLLRGGVNSFTIRVALADGSTTIDTLSVYRPEALVRPAMLYALVIGVNDYGVRHSALSYAVGDAEKIERAIASINEHAMIVKLLDGEATSTRIMAEMKRLASLAQPKDNVVIYYAGHGLSCQYTARDKAYCLVPYANENDPNASQEITIDSLFVQIQNINASGMLVILDACQSGAIAESDGLQRTITKDGVSSVAVIASTTKTARAAESPIIGGGLFTHVVAEGLSGRARDTDGDITAFSLANYVSKKLPGLCQQVGVPVQSTVTQLGSTGTGMVISQSTK